MRNPVIFLVLLAALGLVACEQKVDVAAEEEAIKAAIQNETNAYVNSDYERLAAAWVHEPYVVRTSESGVTVGWDSVCVSFKNDIENAIELKNKEPDKYREEKERRIQSNFDIYLDGNAAFVIHDEHGEGIWAGEEFSFDVKVVKYLVKKDGEWKLVLVGVF